MDNGLIVPYSQWELDDHPGKAQPLSGLRWQAVHDRDAGLRPEVSGTWGQEKTF